MVTISVEHDKWAKESIISGMGERFAEIPTLTNSISLGEKYMEIKTDDYHITYQPDSASVICKGSLLLSSAEEYMPILQLLNGAAEQHNTLTLDVKELEFLNSSGINMFTKFVINVRKKPDLEMTARGYQEIPWQVRFLKNLQRLLPTLELELE